MFAKHFVRSTILIPSTGETCPALAGGARLARTALLLYTLHINLLVIYIN
jgi:hypothetical protein